MKIQSIQTALFRFPPHRPIADAIQQFEAMEVIALTLRSEDGIEGFGFTYTIGRGGKTVKTFLDEEIVPRLLGENALDIERLWEIMWTATHWVGRHGIASLAASAADIALWDHRARLAGLPLYKLLGACRERIPVYNTDGGWLNHTEQQLTAEAAALAEQGFRGVKIKVGKPSAAEDVARVRAVRRVIGGSMPLMVDANMGWRAADAVSRARLLEEFDLFWLEEPIEADDVGGHRRLAERTTIPVAVGESLYNRFAFKEYLAQGAAEILQPDAGRVGGVTEWLRVANMAHGFNVSVAPHFLMELHVHLTCAVPNALFAEYIPFLDRFVETPLKPRNGYLEPPSAPGHGIRFRPETAHPHLIEETSRDL